MTSTTSRPIAFLAHGFNVTDKGWGTIGRLQPFLSSRGVDSITFDMGWMGVVQVYLQNRRHARKVADAALAAKRNGRPVLAIGHSNGCCVLHIATTEFGAPIDHLCYINPALDSDAAPGPSVSTCHVWHSPSDKPVKLAKLLPASDWGAMGATGFTGSDTRVTNFNKELLAVPSVAHSDFADESKLPYYGPLIIQELLHEVRNFPPRFIDFPAGDDLRLCELQHR